MCISVCLCPADVAQVTVSLDTKAIGVKVTELISYVGSSIGHQDKGEIV